MVAETRASLTQRVAILWHKSNTMGLYTTADTTLTTIQHWTLTLSLTLSVTVYKGKVVILGSERPTLYENDRPKPLRADQRPRSSDDRESRPGCETRVSMH